MQWGDPGEIHTVRYATPSRHAVTNKICRCESVNAPLMAYGLENAGPDAGHSKGMHCNAEK